MIDFHSAFCQVFTSFFNSENPEYFNEIYFPAESSKINARSSFPRLKEPLRKWNILNISNIFTNFVFILIVLNLLLVNYLPTCPPKMKHFRFMLFLPMNPFQAMSFFLYSLKTWENYWFSDVFRGYRKKPVVKKRIWEVLVYNKNAKF